MLSNKRLRDLLRIAHIGAALATGAYVYSPFAGEPGFAVVMRSAVVPVLVVTGGLMWQLPRLRRMLHR